ncbi:hypothetical protein Egran_04302 [Elaphomyces granulatus]|uniref:Zn(2)-C6 fungal-type domain-containing protein n=1 Tax=Elaphomyces granulatus TaxID=519963 RepID=A0A232LV29_9EURO|nr:hypothetical protein Egran_04302 [Elaphomyces granulatus]
MAAVASAPVTNGSRDSEKDYHSEHSPSRFTAVNGREGPGPTTNGSSSASALNGIDDRREGVADSGWGTSGYNTPSSRQDERPREGGSLAQDQEDRLSQQSVSVSSRNKRKRSESVERQTSPQQSYHVRSLPRSPRPDDHIDLQTQPASSNGVNASKIHEVQNPSPASYTRTEAGEDNRAPGANAPWQDYDSHLVTQAQRAQHLDTSDAQLAEVLQREAQGPESGQRAWGAVSRSAETSSDVDQRTFAAYDQDRSQGAVQVGPKRKRVFSNRTKTGCMTCRRRKKKCDEQHPACNNCIRGGFLCEGYSSRSTWQKPSSTKAPVPLQSKEGYTDVSTHYIHEPSPQRHERPTATQQLETGKVRPIVVEDGDRAASQYMASPTGAGSNRGSWSKRSWTGAGHATYISDPMSKSEYREVPPIHELSREGQPKTDYHVVPPIRELSHGGHQKPGMPIFQGVDQRPNIDTSSPQAQARMALSIEHQLSSRTAPGEETERDKMIRGDLYRPFDMQLVEDRERCKAALWRFNNACNPQSGVSTKEQTRLLREILIPQSSLASSPSGAPSSRPQGSFGQGAVVEAPFRCHYGYNIHIGEDVMISENCTLVDDCPIHIGAHTWIGPNVSILGSMAHANMQERKGSQSRYQGRPVTIEEDCYVGANCTIYPGVRLRRGAYVAPGEVVKSDIVAYGFQGLKPGYM